MYIFLRFLKYIIIQYILYLVKYIYLYIPPLQKAQSATMTVERQANENTKLYNKKTIYIYNMLGAIIKMCIFERDGTFPNSNINSKQTILVE